VPETLEIKKLGPIGKLTIHPKRLTILIGEQASGKSLVAQLLYFFRGLRSHVGRVYKPGLLDEEAWQAKTLRRILDGLRGVPFGYFANGTATLRYHPHKHGVERQITVTHSNRACRPDKKLAAEMSQWARSWEDQPESLGKEREIAQVFIPTERSVFTRVSVGEPSVLYAHYQPDPLQRFADLLHQALSVYPRAAEWDRLLALASQGDHVPWIRAWRFLLDCQQRALGGGAYVPPSGPKKWKWRIGTEPKAIVLPIEATTSGQMEAWPFFAIAGVFATGYLHEAVNRYLNLYLEEPETHLHPRAQWEVMKAVVSLVWELDHSFVITTHSPFVTYCVNNMIQKFLSYKGQLPGGEVGIDPNMVAAYRLKASPDRAPEDIMDREQTNLIKLDELDSVADEMGEEFERLLDMEG